MCVGLVTSDVQTTVKTIQNVFFRILTIMKLVGNIKPTLRNNFEFVPSHLGTQ